MAEYISQFDQYTGQTSWSDANHRTRFYDGLSEQLKDNLAISDCPITLLQELKMACHDPSHGGSYVAEGAYFIRIGLLPRVVPGDFLNLHLYGLI